MELAHAERESRLVQQVEEERRLEEMRRACYVSLNQLARRFHSVMFLYSQAREQGAPSEAQESALEEARGAYQGIYSEAQMLVPGPVMREAHATNAALMGVYEFLKGIERGTPENPPERLEDYLRSASGRLGLLRNSLRSDLGLDEF
ncbi:hypothetical protein [Streptomyces sp. NPDC002467]|uniref:hypothetical protein n=1 Tax=Streptomyces sp. NPDC002467 TaxID=3364647 RepID=UPI0036A646F4